jgi:hypothetical protein
MPGDAAGRRRRGNAAKSIEFGASIGFAETEGARNVAKLIGPGDIAEADPDTSPTGT